MCLAVPGKIVEIDEDRNATIDVDGITQRVSLSLTPKAGLGDHVLVHAGYAIEVVDDRLAQETADLFAELFDLMDEEEEGEQQVPQGPAAAAVTE